MPIKPVHIRAAQSFVQSMFDSQPNMNWPPGIKGLWMRAWWEIPEIMASHIMGCIGLGLAVVGCYNWVKNDNDHPEFRKVYVIVRHDNPHVKKLKNPVVTKFTKCLTKEEEDEDDEINIL